MQIYSIIPDYQLYSKLQFKVSRLSYLIVRCRGRSHWDHWRITTIFSGENKKEKKTRGNSRSQTAKRRKKRQWLRYCVTGFPMKPFTYPNPTTELMKNLSLWCHFLSSHTIKRQSVRRTEASQIPSLPRGGRDELGREEQVSSRRVCHWTVELSITGSITFQTFLVFFCFTCVLWYTFVFQRQLEDYLNKLLNMTVYRNYHATVRKLQLLTRE